MDKVTTLPIDLGKPTEFKGENSFSSSQNENQAENFSQVFNTKQYIEANGKASAKSGLKNTSAAKNQTRIEQQTTTGSKSSSLLSDNEPSNVEGAAQLITTMREEKTSVSTKSAVEKDELFSSPELVDKPLNIDQSAQLLTLLANADKTLQDNTDYNKNTQVEQNNQQHSEKAIVLTQASEQHTTKLGNNEVGLQDENSIDNEPFDEGVLKPKVVNMRVINEKLLASDLSENIKHKLHDKTNINVPDSTSHIAEANSLSSHGDLQLDSDLPLKDHLNNINNKISDHLTREEVVTSSNKLTKKNTAQKSSEQSNTDLHNSSLSSIGKEYIATPVASSAVIENLNIKQRDKASLVTHSLNNESRVQVSEHSLKFSAQRVSNNHNHVITQGDNQSDEQIHATKMLTEASKVSTRLTSEEQGKIESDNLLKANEKTVKEHNNSVIKNTLTQNIFTQQTSDTSTLAHYSADELQALQSLAGVANKVTEVNLHEQKIALAKQVETIAIYRKDFVNNLQDKVLVMVQQKLQQVDIRLDPPELGQMQVKLHLHNDQASIQFIVQNQQAKEALDQNMPKLREMLAEQGVNVGDANVGQQSERGFEKEDNIHQDQQGRALVDNDALEHSQVFSAQVVKGSATGVDYYA